MMKFICALLVVSIITVSAFSFTCGSGRTFVYPTTYQYPLKEIIVRNNFIAVPVLVPAYQFQYVPTCTPIVASPIVPAAAAVAGMQQGTYGPIASAGVGAVNGANQDRERIRLLARALLEEMSKEADSNTGSATNDNGHTDSATNDNGPPVVSGFSSPSNTQVRQLSWVSVLHNRCSACHTGSTSKAGVMIFTSPGRFNPGVDRHRLLDAIKSGRMPLGASANPRLRLSTQEINVVESGLSR